ncbi:MAG: CsgG/HfaB family protein [Gammaproteobacteria bacterium]
MSKIKAPYIIGFLLVFLLNGCATTGIPPGYAKAGLSSRTSTYHDLKSLPAPKGKIVVSVYDFRDQTGQYKPAPASTFSTAVSQGGTAMLIEALSDSEWFITLEREGLQNLLTERKIVRAAQKKPNVPSNSNTQLPSLLAANVLIEGGVVAYESNLQTGGVGAKYLGIGFSEQYRVDQVTVNLRAINVNTGRIINNVSTTKKVLSKELQTGVFRFVEFKKLLEIETGVTTNEPAQMCVRAAIEAAVIHTIVDGIDDGNWSVADASDLQHPIVDQYRKEKPRIIKTLSSN